MATTISHSNGLIWRTTDSINTKCKLNHTWSLNKTAYYEKYCVKYFRRKTWLFIVDYAGLKDKMAVTIDNNFTLKRIDMKNDWFNQHKLNHTWSLNKTSYYEKYCVKYFRRKTWLFIIDYAGPKDKMAVTIDNNFTLKRIDMKNGWFHQHKVTGNLVIYYQWINKQNRLNTSEEKRDCLKLTMLVPKPRWPSRHFTPNKNSVRIHNYTQKKLKQFIKTDKSSNKAYTLTIN